MSPKNLKNSISFVTIFPEAQGASATSVPIWVTGPKMTYQSINADLAGPCCCGMGQEQGLWQVDLRRGTGTAMLQFSELCNTGWVHLTERTSSFEYVSFFSFPDSVLPHAYTKGRRCTRMHTLLGLFNTDRSIHTCHYIVPWFGTFKKSKVQAVIYEALDIFKQQKKNILFNEHPHFAGPFSMFGEHISLNGSPTTF